MVNLEKARVNHNLGASGGIAASPRPPTTSPGARPARRLTSSSTHKSLRRARIAATGVPHVTKRHAHRRARLFSAPGVAYLLGSGILALVNGSPYDAMAAPVLLESRHGTRSRRRAALSARAASLGVGPRWPWDDAGVLPHRRRRHRGRRTVPPRA